MLSVNQYEGEYVARCRARMDAQLAAYRALVAKTKGADAAVSAFESQFLANLVLALDACFVHRSRTLEGKDGNPLNEVRMLGNSLLLHDGVMTADKSIKLRPEASILKLPFGARIELSVPQFQRLQQAFFDAIEAKFV